MIHTTISYHHIISYHIILYCTPRLSDSPPCREATGKPPAQEAPEPGCKLRPHKRRISELKDNIYLLQLGIVCVIGFIDLFYAFLFYLLQLRIRTPIEL